MEPINEAVLNENESPSGGKRLKKGGKAPMIILCALVAVAAAAYLGLCAYVNTLQTFAPNRHINGVDVGGLTVAQAQEVLETTLPAQEVVVTDPVLQMQTSVTLADLGYTAECRAGEELTLLSAVDGGEHFIKGVDAQGMPRFEVQLCFRGVPAEQD